MNIFTRFISFFILIVLLPFLLIISSLIFIIDSKPILFKQIRIGYKFEQFWIYKFRTMNFRQGGNLITRLNDNRITILGRFLRKYKIDELPQLINILKGEMRFIGPRPEVEKFVNKKKFIFLNEIKPGLSDFSSIIFRNEEHILSNLKTKNSYEKILLPLKIDLAKIYSKNKSIKLDLVLIIATMSSIFFPNLTQNIILNKIIPFYDKKIKSKVEDIIFFK